VSSEDLEEYESDVELQLYREYRDVCPMFRFVVETERRFYLANEVDQRVVDDDGRTRVEIDLRDAWVWDMYRQNRFVTCPCRHVQGRQHRRVAQRGIATPVTPAID